MGTTCLLQVYAAVNSNRPQPPSGQAAEQVGAALVVTKVTPSSTGVSGGSETFQDAGQTPPDANKNNVVSIPTRRPLGSNYPGPGGSGVLLPVASGVGRPTPITIPSASTSCTGR